MNKITLLIFFFSVILMNAQSSWKKLDSKNYNAKTELTLSKTSLSDFDLYSLDANSFKEEITNNNTVMIPVNGSLINFNVKESSIFTEKINNEYGDIKSFTLKGIDDKTASGKISLGMDGVHIIIFSTKHSTVYIDPYTKSKSTYITYQKEDILNHDDGFICLTEDKINAKEILSDTAQKSANANDGTLRTYRLALACTIEYSDFHINNLGLANNASNAEKKAAVLSAMNTTITRVNGILEKEIATTLNIVTSNGENELIFIDDDNFSNDNGFELIDESQEVCDDIIGTNNYDIGHTFSTGGGGLASLGSLCSSSTKGKGITGSTFPIGDSFDIDFVAHEIGHQLGANHSYNNSCDENRWEATAVEPGSGSTIMGYAGICVPNVQNNSDDYFHSVSLDQMWAVISRTSCATETNTNNTAPVVNAGSNFSVPISTPLILKGEASDVDDDILTYCWEQTDIEIATMSPLSTNIAGPAFRSLPPTENPNRYLPELNTVIGGSTSSEWEVIPSVAREMNFSLVVRDNNINGGANERDDMTIDFIDTDPFIVTSPSANADWDVGTTETITWDKSTTDQSPINCENVKITLSTDGGKTFPITLVESTPNDGSYDAIVPNQITSTARIMVEGIDHIFYNVNAVDFSIFSSGPTFLLSNLTKTQETCNDETSSVDYTIDVDFINGFSETVTLAIEDLPTGVDASFSSQTITESREVTISLSNFQNTTLGNYNISVTGTSSSLNSRLELSTLIINDGDFEDVTLSFPQNNAVNTSTENLTLTWSGTENQNTLLYDLEVASDSNFNTILFSEENITTNSFSFTENLDWETTFYWKVKPKNNCREGDFSTVYNFTTENEAYCPSTFVNVAESEFISNVTFGAINNDSGDDNISDDPDGYEDFTNLNTSLKPGETYNLEVSIDPIGFQDHCYAFIDWDNDSRFNTTTERYDLGNVIEQPGSVDLDIFVPLDAALGETRMRIVIEFFSAEEDHGDGPCDTDHNTEFGETEDYSLIITDDILSLDDVFNNFNLYPNPIESESFNDTSFNLEFIVPFKDEDIILNLSDLTGRIVMSATYKNNSSIIFEESINTQSLSSGIYLLNVFNGSKKTSKKLIIR